VNHTQNHDKTDLIVPVILAGGAGTRLWPLSRPSLPKQFLNLTGDATLFQQTIQRVSNPQLFAPPVVVTHVDFRFFAAEQLREIGVTATILLEPERRDSAAAIAAASVFIAQRSPRARVLVLAADHLIGDQELFEKACQSASEMASHNRIVTFGIKPTSAHTAYGYIRPGPLCVGTEGHCIEAFVEKPDAITAQQYCDQGYLWNCGNFLFPVELMCDELALHAPDIFHPVQEAVMHSQSDLLFERLAPEPFSRARALSIDYAVMEKTAHGAVLPCAFSWSDIGSWDAVWQHISHDENENAVFGHSVLSSTHSSLIHSDGPLIAVHGVHDLAVIASKDAVLIMPRKETQNLKSLVARIEKSPHAHVLQPSRVHRPWGYYEEVDKGERFLVKRIVVKPEKRLSLQQHVHRSEHWVVVRGTAEVTIGDSVRLIQENESIYVPLGTIHRLANPGKIALEVIEVQTGSYLAEDDIIRLSDDFNRM
jgi:mannose-1-phosphate guanylyltransferase / mannose-6-phosphate isomerase